MQLILEWVLSDVSCVLWCLPKSPSPEDALSQRLFLVVWEHSWGRETWGLHGKTTHLELAVWPSAGTSASLGLASFFFFFFLYKLENPRGPVRWADLLLLQRLGPHTQISVALLPAAGAGCLPHSPSTIGEDHFPLTCEVPQSTPHPLELLGAFHLLCFCFLFPSEPRPPWRNSGNLSLVHFSGLGP